MWMSMIQCLLNKTWALLVTICQFAGESQKRIEEIVSETHTTRNELPALRALDAEQVYYRAPTCQETETSRRKRWSVSWSRFLSLEGWGQVRTYARRGRDPSEEKALLGVSEPGKSRLARSYSHLFNNRNFFFYFWHTGHHRNCTIRTSHWRLCEAGANTSMMRMTRSTWTPWITLLMVSWDKSVGPIHQNDANYCEQHLSCSWWECLSHSRQMALSPVGNNVLWHNNN